MKATGITRRIDDLGRIVIPKEIRRTLRVREGDPLEIFTDRDGLIILKKYSPVGEMGEFVEGYAEVLAQVLGSTVCITDKDVVVAAAGTGRKELLEQPLDRTMETCMEERRIVEDREFMEGYTKQILIPILAAGDVVGSIVLLRNTTEAMTEVEQKVILSAAGFIGRQMESI